MTPDLEWRFTYHPPNDENKARHHFVRRECLDLAEYFDTNLVDGREKSLALTKLEEVMFWANASIARERVT